MKNITKMTIAVFLLSQNLYANSTVKAANPNELPILDEKPFQPDSTVEYKLAKKLIAESKQNVIQLRPGRNTQEMIAVTELDLSQQREQQLRQSYMDRLHSSNKRFDQLEQKVQDLIKEIDAEIEKNKKLKSLVLKSAIQHPEQPITAQKLAFEIVADQYRLSANDRQYYLAQGNYLKQSRDLSKLLQSTKNPEDRAKIGLRFFNLKKLTATIKANPGKSAIGLAAGVGMIASGRYLVGQTETQTETKVKYRPIQQQPLHQGAK